MSAGQGTPQERSPYPRPARSGGGGVAVEAGAMITRLWVIGAIVTGLGFIIMFSSDGGPRGGGGSEGGLFLGYLLWMGGGGCLLVAIIATGVRLGREASP